MINFEASYANLARALADALREYARNRRFEDQKEIARLQTGLCNIRRDEMNAALTSADHDATN